MAHIVLVAVLVVLTAYGCLPLPTDNKVDQPILVAMRNALKKMDPQDLVETSRSLKNVHEESKSLMPSNIAEHNTVCWTKCKPGETNMRSILLKDVLQKDAGKRRQMTHRAQKKHSNGLKEVALETTKMLCMPTLKIQFTPGEDDDPRGWQIITQMDAVNVN